jgi:hypothetical protein
VGLMINFILKFGKINTEIGRLLRYRFLPGKHAYDTVIGKLLKRILEYHNSGKYQKRDRELGRMFMLIKHLRSIENYDDSLLKCFRKEIKRADTTDGFYGTRFEINIAASLIQKDILFKKQESPDFIVYYNSSEIGIECGSTRIRKEVDNPDLYYKIGSTINSKTRKPYSDSSTSLFIDMTNLIHSILKAEGRPNFDKIREKVKSSINNNDFGSVILFTYLYMDSKSRFESNYIRVNNSDINKELNHFLNIYYNKGEHNVRDFDIPWEG